LKHLRAMTEAEIRQSMTRGTVAKRWAWTHHPAWYRRATGRDPRADYRAALERETVGARRGQ
jgi:cytochrome b subunit of formate dehydrogenase